MEEGDEFDDVIHGKGCGSGHQNSSHTDTMISKQRRSDVINGLFRQFDASLEVPHDIGRQVRVYLSSAGKDSEVERTVLVERVVPEVRTFCRERGLDFQLIDLRWGIPEDKLTEVLTPELCHEELTRCQRVSSGPCYFLFLSDRLSDRSLPVRVSLPLFDHACAALFQRKLDPNRLIQWFRMDRNVIPAEYVLKKEELETSPANTDGSLSQEVLGLLEKSVITVHKKNRLGDLRLKLLGSGLEWLTYTDLLSQHAEAQRAVCVIRDFRDINMADQTAHAHTDVRSGVVDPELKMVLRTLKDDIISEDGEVMMDTAFHATLAWDTKGVDPDNKAHAQYLDAMATNVVQQTRRCILRTLKRRTHASCDWLLEEVLNHVTYARQVDNVVRVREDLLEQVLMYISDTGVTRNQPLIVYGDAGSGKSLVLGRVAMMSNGCAGEGSVVAVRFAGTTLRSQTLLDILCSLILQISEAYGVHYAIGSHSYGTSAMAYCFLKLIERLKRQGEFENRTLVIIIDAIDLLFPKPEVDNDDIIDLSWLPGVLPPKVKVVLSCRWGRETLERRFQGRANRSNMVYIDPLGQKVAEDVFDSWMVVAGRQVTRPQREVLRDVLRDGAHPLVLRMVFSEMCTWSSFSESDRKSAIVGTGSGSNEDRVFKAFFGQLEKQHGAVLVARVFGYLLAARDGLTECELVDVLSADDDVMRWVVGAWCPPCERVLRLPQALWARLRLALEEHLVTGLSGGSRVLKIRRSLLYDLAVRRYLSPDLARPLHTALAHYFLATHHDKVKPLTTATRTYLADRKQPSQPLRFGGPAGPVNFRLLTELPYQLHQVGLHNDLVTACLGNYDWVSTVSASCGLDDVLRDVSMAMTSSSLSSRLRHQLSLLRETLEMVQVSHTRGRPDNPLAVAIVGRLVALSARYPEVIGKLVHGAQQYCANPRRSLLAPLRACFPSPCGAAVDRLVGHQGGAIHLDVSQDGSTIVSGGADGMVKVWRGGRIIRSLHHTDEVRHVCLLAHLHRVVTLAGNRLHFMDLNTGELLHVLSIPKVEVYVTPAETLERALGPREIVCRDTTGGAMALRLAATIFFFDLEKMTLTHTLEGHVDAVTCLAISEGGGHLVSGAVDQTVRVWHTDLGQELHIIGDHVSAVTDVAVAPTNQFVSVSLGGTIIVAHLLTGNLLRRLTWPGHALYSAAFSKTGTRIAVGSYGEIGLWDPAVGKLVATVTGHRQNISHIKYIEARNLQNQKFENLMSMSQNGELKIWNIEDDNLSHCASGAVGKDATVKVASNKAVMGSRDSPFLKVWSLNFDPEKTTAPLEGGIFDPIAISADGKYVVTIHSNCTDLVLHDVSRGVELHKLPAHQAKITCLAMLSDNEHVLSGAEDGLVKMWYRNGETLEEVQSMHFQKKITRIASHPKNKMAVICHKENVVRLRHMNNKEVDEAYIEVQDSNITVVVVGEDQIVYGTDKGKVYVWTYENVDNPVMMLVGHTRPVRHITIRERYLATVGEGEQCIIIWNCQTGKRLGDLPTGDETVTSLTWSSDMHHLIIGFDTCMVHIYDVIAQTKLTSLNVHSPVSAIVAKSDIISISTTGGYFGVYRLVVSENFDPSVYSDSLESRYSISSLQASRPALHQGGSRRKSSTCSLV